MSEPPARSSVLPPPVDDADVPRFVAELGLPGLVDIHVHFLPERMLAKVWDYFDQAESHYGMAWPVHYRTSEPERVATLAALGVAAFAPLVYPHKPGMGRWLTEWVAEFAARPRGRCRPPRCSRSRTSPSTWARR